MNITADRTFHPTRTTRTPARTPRRTTGRLAVAATLAAPLALTVGAPADAAPTRTTPESSTTQGPAPRIPYIVGRTLTDGDRTIRLDKVEGRLSVHRVAAPGDGLNWVVFELMDGAAEEIRVSRYAEDGSRVTLATTNSFTSAVSDRSTRLAYITDLSRKRSRVTVIDSFSGDVVAERTFTRVDNLDLDEQKVVLSRRTPQRRSSSAMVTWNYQRNQVDPLIRRFGAADIAADRIVVERKSRRSPGSSQIRRLSNPRDVVVADAGRNLNLGWNSTGRRFLQGFEGAALGQITVRRDPQYTVASRLDGRRTSTDFATAAWESMRRWITVEFDDDSARLLRCDLRSRCTQITDPFRVNAEYIVNSPDILLGS